MDEVKSDSEIKQQRIENMQKLVGMGYEAFGRSFQTTGSLPDLKNQFEEGRKVQVAGRLVSRREMGKSIFAHIQELGVKFQVYIKKDLLSEEAFSAFRVLDIGDIIGIEGETFVTHKGEPTIKVTGWNLLAKSLLPLPEKWHGLQDVETRYRRRYLDLIANEEVFSLFKKRTTMISEIRSFLTDRGYYEVETPMLQALAGGAAANPFKTFYQALGQDMYMRIAPELYLKRLLVGGFDKVFELNRNFRNEGLDRSHNPEFTMVEMYQAYGDVNTMKVLVKGLLIHLAEKVFGTTRAGSEDQPVDLSPEAWTEREYDDLIKECAGEDWFDLSLDDAKKRAAALGCDVDPAWDAVDLSQEIFEKLIEKTLINPTFVTRLPSRIVPLAKACSDDASKVDVFELIIGGREIAPGYSELNDPIIQRQRLEEQAAGDSEKIDNDFLTALEYGMPPAGGMGIGVDRLFMLLSGEESIRDVILFPQLKNK